MRPKAFRAWLAAAVWAWASCLAVLASEVEPSVHWSLQPVEIPSAGVSIDGLIEECLEYEGLESLPAAASEVLLRRLAFDVLGLPPTLEEREAFHEDSPEQAVSRWIDRLLASPHFGERWARHWLDVVRYSETKGHVTDIERPFAWKYRDYVIDAFNEDVPYDQFVREHIAGDLLRPGRPGWEGQTNVSPTATGALFFHEMHFMAVDPVKQRWDEIDAQIDVVTKAFLGLTVACARCHDHKTDPVSQEDYYALAGYFYSTEQGKARTAPRASGPSADALAAERELDQFLQAKREGRFKAQRAKNGEYFPVSEELGVQSPGDYAKLTALMNRVARLDPSWSHWVRAARDVEGKDVPLLVRGDYRLKGDPVPRRFLTALGGDAAKRVAIDGGSGRLHLAEALADAGNPLTARVWVNRLWHHLFGRGLQPDPSDFGVNGPRPSHPELLDYLAWRLVERGWSTKAVLREILHSETYQRASASPLGRDPENRWLSRQNRRRLEGEAIRDALLQVSEQLDRKLRGPSVQPWIPPYATANKPSNVPQSGPLDGRGRRSVYLKVRRNFPDVFLKTFDFPDPGLSTGEREVTTPPSQALAMMNSPLVHALVKRWAARASAEEASWERFFWSALGRGPSGEERELLQGLDLLEDRAHAIVNLAEFRYVD